MSLKLKHILFFMPILLVSIKATAQLEADTTLIKQHLTKIINTNNYRNSENIEVLNNVASYIHETFEQYADTTYFQPFTIGKNTYKNVICSFGSNKLPTLVIGAHYDVCGNQDGADDNASGVAGLLELARLLKGAHLNYKIELVAYTLEEPPFFRTNQMGSYIHAKSLIDNKTTVLGMVSLEMIGYYSNKENSQLFPDPQLSELFGTKGDFITLVNRLDNENFEKNFSVIFSSLDYIKSEIFSSTSTVNGVDFSDHLNYWNFGFDAIMITDTAFLRNRNYHTKEDTLDLLNIGKVGNVVDSVFQTILRLN